MIPGTILLLLMMSFTTTTHAHAASATSAFYPEFLPDTPRSEFVQESEKLWSTYERPGTELPSELPPLDFCAQWNPEFPYNGHHCCRNLASLHSRKNRVSCFSKRPRLTYCGEMTDEQIAYPKAVASIDVLERITREMGSRGDQAYCTQNNGFLVHGRRIVPSEMNRIALKSPERCTEFGTDNMVGMLEWLGRKIREKYSTPEYAGVRLIIGDVSAPRGGCLSGPSGRHGHLSHTNGEDADVGLLYARQGVRSPAYFHRDFDAKTNWWMIKSIFSNPYACVKVIFLDRRHIRKLAKAAAADEQWIHLRRFIRHQAGHRNHMHVRIGDHPGSPGCVANPKPELEIEVDPSASDGDGPGDAAVIESGTGLASPRQAFHVD